MDTQLPKPYSITNNKIFVRKVTKIKNRIIK